MNALNVLSDLNREEILGDELEKLFAFQDKHLSKDKSKILVQALLESNLPLKSILLGIEKLKNEDLSSIKLSTLFAAARSYVEQGEQIKSCERCTDGLISMKDHEDYRCAVACFCLRGQQRAKALNIVIWNGKEIFVNHGRTFELVFKDPPH